MDKSQLRAIKNARIDETYYTGIHPSGLTLLLYPMAGYSTAHALFGTRYGSIDTTFKTSADRDFLTVPDGIAHFLEHKMFDNKDGDAFSLFSKTGASANAFTSFDKTCYLFSCADHFKESLDILLRFVTEPYFTSKSVQKEQGIIGQEIRMYDDNPNWRVYFNLLDALYVNHPVQRDIAGTVESIAQIDDKLLYDCYHTFYNLSNMVLSIAGNFEIDTVLEACDRILSGGKSIAIERAKVDEPAHVDKHEVRQKLEVAQPLFSIGFKEAPAEGKALVQKLVHIELLTEIIAGDSSALYRKLYDKGLINSTFCAEPMSGRGYLCTIFEGESNDPKQVMKLLLEAFEDARKNGISQHAFDCAKKAMYGKNIRLFNNVEAVASALINSYFSDAQLYDTIEAVSTVELCQLEQTLHDCFCSDRAAISIVENA